MHKTIIAVSPIEKNFNPQKKIINALLKESGLKQWNCVGISALYRMEGPLTKNEIYLSAQELLCDPVIEKFSINSKPSQSRLFFSDIWFKKGVTDPVAESILKALQDLKIRSNLRASSGTRYEFICKKNRSPSALLKKQLAEFSYLNLLNPLIQECKLISYDQPC